MDTDNSNDVIITSGNNEIDNMIEIPADKPLMHLFKRLIGDNKQSTMLTNAQIINILQKELDINVAYLHDLEVEIYLNLVKKFLKDWPQWDPFDIAINKLKEKKDYDYIRTLLHDTHLKLKQYLKEVLNKARPMMKSTIAESIEKNKNDNANLQSDFEVVMETYCSREQLNDLIMRRPSSKYSIFNVIDGPVFKNNLPYKAIFNWWDVQISFNMGCFIYKRETQHELQHTLINKKLNKDSNSLQQLNPNWQCKARKSSAVDVEISDMLRMINRIVLHYNKIDKYKSIVESIFELISLDLNGAPDSIRLFTDYRRYMSKYSYVRYLYSENDEDLPAEGNMYDLRLKEVISPRFVFQLSKLEFTDNALPDNLDWINVRCGYCIEKIEFFPGDRLLKAMSNHFSNSHSNEPNWQCVSCGLELSMLELAENRWEHTC